MWGLSASPVALETQSLGEKQQGIEGFIVLMITHRSLGVTQCLPPCVDLVQLARFTCRAALEDSYI